MHGESEIRPGQPQRACETSSRADVHFRRSTRFGHAMPAFSNFVDAMAAELFGNAYLPSGFNNTAHAGQRATLQFRFTAAGNLFREFAPQMPRPVRTAFQSIAR
jgi:hypothetical protein